jgi:teichuronic acid biosynthesis glycosyltransferase TuaC
MACAPVRSLAELGPLEGSNDSAAPLPQSRPIKLLTFTTLYPNAAQPQHGIFVETRLRKLLESGAAESVVVAPVPWFPSTHTRFGRYRKYAQAPQREQRRDITILHPRYPAIPKIGMTAAPFLLASGATPTIKRLLAGGYEFDLIDAHYFYPDGVAAILLGQLFNKPVVITARGSDLNLIAKYRLPRKLIQWAGRRARQLIAVSEALKDKLLQLGIAADRVTVLRNGVDSSLFFPVDRERERARLELTGTILLSVGNLIPGKGHDLVILSLALLSGVRLLIAGHGPEAGALNRLTARLGLVDRVKFLGTVTQNDLRRFYGVADALVLASVSEGWPNVLLESMACGTPVIATKVGAAPDLVTTPEAGRLLKERTPYAIAETVRDLLSQYPDRNATRRHAERFSWDEPIRNQIGLYRRVISPCS